METVRTSTRAGRTDVPKEAGEEAWQAHNTNMELWYPLALQEECYWDYHRCHNGHSNPCAQHGYVRQRRRHDSCGVNYTPNDTTYSMPVTPRWLASLRGTIMLPARNIRDQRFDGQV